jgi:hypothetical protein
MIASRFKKDHQNQLLGRRRVLCRSDPLSGSTIASVVRSEVVVLCAVYAGAASCQADVLPHLFSTPNLIVASRINLLQPSDRGKTMEGDVRVVAGLRFSLCWHLRKQLLHSWCKFYCNFAFSLYMYIVNRGQCQLFVVRNVRIVGVPQRSCSRLGMLRRLS